ncbi:MAG: cryptochrome/photolyase family protein [Ilumatobacteraceae bacterium]
MTSTTVMWFRRDLRITDLPALHAAAAVGPVVPLFVVDPAFDRAGAARRAFMCRALRSLDDAVDRALVYRYGDPVDVVPRFAAEVGATTVHVTRDFGPYGRRRDAAVAERLRADGRRLVGVGTPYAVSPGSVEKGGGGPYAVFTPFARAWRATGWDAPLAVPSVEWRGAPGVPCEGPPPMPGLELEPVHEGTLSLLADAAVGTAVSRWQQYLPRVTEYDTVRDRPAVDGTSRLSAALRWGLVPPRQRLDDLGPVDAHRAADDVQPRGTRVFVNELAWREFYADVLFRAPESAWHNLNPRMDAMPVDRDAAALTRFTRWCEGMTGFPVVDAGMRQLQATGWMHNRVRMIVASFLVKDLHLPWQWGAKHFMRHLVDGDLASNSHGWQWTAGTGTDAAPYFRVFNPTGQGERFDPEGDFVRRWVPELAGLAGRAVHAPGPLRPDGYPPPMVDHAAERAEALARYRVVTGR